MECLTCRRVAHRWHQATSSASSLVPRHDPGVPSERRLNLMSRLLRLIGLHEVRQDVDGQREYDRRVLLGGDCVERLRINHIIWIKNKSAGQNATVRFSRCSPAGTSAAMQPASHRSPRMPLSKPSKLSALLQRRWPWHVLPWRLLLQQPLHAGAGPAAWRLYWKLKWLVTLRYLIELLEISPRHKQIKCPLVFYVLNDFGFKSQKIFYKYQLLAHCGRWSFGLRGSSTPIGRKGHYC